MPRPPKARAPLKQAALELFVERGVHAAGIRELARHAGCSEAALYRHWENKEALVRALYVEHLAEVMALLDAAITTAKAAASEPLIAVQVRQAVKAAYRLYDEQPLVFRFILLIQHELAKELPPDYRVPNDVVIDLIKAAIARNEIPPCDPALHASWLVGMFLETATFVLYGRLPGPLSQHVDGVTAAVLRVLRVGEAR
ncbi:TetR family transcriptional regulator [Planctomycetota bacterium]|nr:TetR family transcriptional regulator [Planctomycetota bacterium]